MVKELSITLNQDTAKVPYVSGSTITGTLTIEVSEPKMYSKIRILLRGNGLVRWTISTGGPEVSTCGPAESTTIIDITESYTNQQVVVWTKEDSPDGTFPPGRYTYPFQFTLPTNCPSSYRSGIGKITYMIKGVVTNTYGKTNHKIQHPISVVELRSGIGLHQTQRPVRFERRKTVGCWFCKSGEITFNAEVERIRFKCGEELPLSFCIENGSGRRIKVRCELVETVNYYSNGTHSSPCTLPNQLAKRTYSVAHSISEPINPHTASGQQVLKLPIPKNLRPAMTRSNIIKSVYTVQVTLVIPYACDISNIKFGVVISNASVPQQHATSQF